MTTSSESSNEELLTLLEELLSLTEGPLLYNAAVDKDMREAWHAISARVADMREARVDVLRAVDLAEIIRDCDCSNSEEAVELSKIVLRMYKNG